MKNNLIWFITGMASCAALCAVCCCCPKAREWRERAMEKGREAKRKARDAWDRFKHDTEPRVREMAHKAPDHVE